MRPRSQRPRSRRAIARPSCAPRACAASNLARPPCSLQHTAAHGQSAPNLGLPCITLARRPVPDAHASLAHSAAKQKEREERIRSLPAEYHAPITLDEERLLSRPVAELVAAVQAGTLAPPDVLRAYGKKALRAHAATNCLTEVLLADAEGWAAACNVQGPLAGVPVSLKDTVSVAGVDACIGYSAWVGRPAARDAPLVRLLRDAGALPFAKTNVPITLLSFESANDVFGRTTNPHNADYSPGGSSGGEAALLAYGGSRLGVGTDVAGSVRAPA